MPGPERQTRHRAAIPTLHPSASRTRPSAAAPQCEIVPPGLVTVTPSKAVMKALQPPLAPSGSYWSAAYTVNSILEVHGQTGFLKRIAGHIGHLAVDRSIAGRQQHNLFAHYIRPRPPSRSARAKSRARVRPSSPDVRRHRLQLIGEPAARHAAEVGLITDHRRAKGFLVDRRNPRRSFGLSNRVVRWLSAMIGCQPKFFHRHQHVGRCPQHRGRDPSAAVRSSRPHPSDGRRRRSPSSVARSIRPARNAPSRRPRRNSAVPGAARSPYRSARNPHGRRKSTRRGEIGMAPIQSFP